MSEKKKMTIQSLENTAIQAILRNDVNQLMMLVNNQGIDVNTSDKVGRTLLMHSVIQHNLEMVTFLLQKGVDVNIRDSNGYTALHFAAQEHLLDIADLLLRFSAQVDAPDAHGNTPLFKAVFFSQGRGELIQLLLARGANKDLKNFHGVSPNSLAQTINNYDVKRYFQT